MTKKNEHRRGYDKITSAAIGLGTQSAVCIGFMVWLGIWLDEKYDSSPSGILGCLAFAFIYVFYEIWKIMRIMSEEAKKKKDERNKVK